MTMLEAKKESLWWGCIISPLKILFDSLKILLSNKLLFTSITLFTTIPFSFFLFTLKIYGHILRYRIYHLDSTANLSPTPTEAPHVSHESPDDGLSLLRTMLPLSLPLNAFALAAAVSTVHVTLSAVNGNTATMISAMRNCYRPAVTAANGYAIIVVFARFPRDILADSIVSPEWRILSLAIGWGFEAYLVAVVSMGLVVSIAEERSGFEALWIGSGLMRERRFCGWVLSGLFVLASGLINWRQQFLMNGQDSTVVIGVWDKTFLICSHGLVLMLSYVISTVFYCDSRERHWKMCLESWYVILQKLREVASYL